MVVGWHRPTRLHIDTQAITENVQKECQRLPEGTALFAVVKANGYGHGAVETAKAALLVTRKIGSQVMALLVTRKIGRAYL